MRNGSPGMDRASKQELADEGRRVAGNSTGEGRRVSRKTPKPSARVHLKRLAGLNFHGRHEFVPIQSMEKAMMTVVNIASLTPALSKEREN